MTITAPELVLLGKCLAMTTSNQDGEALAAMRRANAILARHKLSWPEFLQLKFPIREGFTSANAEQRARYAGARASGFAGQASGKSNVDDLVEALRRHFDGLGPF